MLVGRVYLDTSGRETAVVGGAIVVDAAIGIVLVGAGTLTGATVKSASCL